MSRGPPDLALAARHFGRAVDALLIWWPRLGVTTCLCTSGDRALEGSAHLAPPPDWARANPLGCTCADCRELGAFLVMPDRQKWHLEAIQHRRTHVELSVKNAHCDLATERRGSPHTLIATKNQASYERRVKERRQDLESLAALDGST